MLQVNASGGAFHTFFGIQYVPDQTPYWIAWYIKTVSNQDIEELSKPDSGGELNG